jgi:hypothetical protein
MHNASELTILPVDGLPASMTGYRISPILMHSWTPRQHRTGNPGRCF